MMLPLRWRWGTVLDALCGSRGRHPLLDQLLRHIDDGSIPPRCRHDITDLDLCRRLDDVAVDPNPTGRTSIRGLTPGLEDPNRPQPLVNPDTHGCSVAG